MKGLVIFHDHELAFCHADKDLEKYLKERWDLLQKSAGATDQDLGMRDLSSIFQEFLQPFCTAFDALASLKKTMHSISLDDGFMIAFKKFGQSLYIALSKGHDETEANLFKKIQVFNSILSFLEGPVKRRIRPKEKIQTTLEQLLVTYEKLCEEDEVFLLEVRSLYPLQSDDVFPTEQAVEHVTFGQLQAAQDVVVKLAKESLEPSNNGGLTRVQHAMLIVNSKLLAICGKTPQLITSDMLLLTLFVCCFFSKDREEVGEEQGEGDEYGDMSGMDPQTSVRPDASPDRSEVFQTPPMSTPGSYREAEDPPFSTPGPEPDPTFTTPVDEPESMTSIRESANPSRGIPSRLRSLFGLRNPRAGDTEALEEDVEDSAKSWKFVEQDVFLQPNTATFIPHRLHCLEVCPGIVLVLISECGLNQLAGTISLILHHLDEIFNCNIRGGQSVFDMLEEHFRRTNSLVRHEVQATASATLRQCGVLVQNAWLNLKEAGIRHHLISPQLDITPRLESSGSSLTKKLIELFEQLFFTPKQRDYDTAYVKHKLIRNFSGLRKDYGEFLALKGTMNIPMLNFSMCHPGMLHFILVDRSFDEMITPSVHRDQPVGVTYVEKLASEMHMSSGELLKKTIWEMVKRSQKYLGHGYTSQTWLDQNFLYSYYAWVNQHSLALNESRRFLPPTVKSPEGYPGIIGNSFYRDLAQGQCYVFELYCIHEAAVPIKLAAMQCRELANQLWPNTKAAIAPFSLIN